MQTTIRKRRSYFRNGNTRFITIACFSLILSSCSLFNKKPQPFQSKRSLLEDLQTNICKKASGSGRIKIFSQTHRFTYESELTSKEFKLLIDIPFKGQETIILDLKNSKNAGGTIVNKIFDELTSKKDFGNKKLLNSFLEKTSKFLTLVTSDIETSCKKNKCNYVEIKKIEEEIIFTDKISNKAIFAFSFKSLFNGSYRKVSLSATDQEKGSSQLLGLDLRVDYCE